MKRFALLLIFLFIVSFAYGEKSKRCDLGNSSYMTFKYRGSKGVGYENGYSTIGIFASPNWNRSMQVFMDIRAHVLNNARFASNFGVGMRGATGSEKWVYGGNIYWDYRDTHNLASNQLGAGFEVLSNIVDFRLNGYLPVSKKKDIARSKFDHFEGNQIIIRSHCKGALPSIYGEIGVPIRGFFRKIDLYFAAGPYYLFRRQLEKSITCGNNWGGRVRGSAKILNGVTVGVDFTYDKLFHGRVQGYATLSFPFGPGVLRRYGGRWRSRFGGSKECNQSAVLKRLLTQPVWRNEIIPICQRTCRTPLEGSNGQPLAIYFANNSAGSGGNGTFEDPFALLADAIMASSVNDILYLYEGTGSAYIGGATLQNGQILQGSSETLSLPDNVSVPPMTHLPPLITNAGGAGVTLASNVMVKGIVVDAPSTEGILGLGVSNVQIDAVTINTPGAEGLRLVDLTGPMTLSNADIEMPTLAGINISELTGTMNVSSTIIRNGSSQGLTVSTDGIGTLHLNDVNFDQVTGIGYEIITDGAGYLLTTISNSEMRSSGASAISILSSDSSIVSSSISNNVITTNSGVAADAPLFMNVMDAATQNTNLIHNLLNTTTDFSYNGTVSDETGVACQNLDDNTINGTGLGNIRLNNVNGGGGGSPFFRVPNLPTLSARNDNATVMIPDGAIVDGGDLSCP